MDFKSIVDFINSQDMNAGQRYNEDTLKYLIYNGRLKEIVAEKIQAEFEDPKQIMQLQERIVPINVIKKMVDKLGKVYKVEPIRRPMDLNPGDQDLISSHEASMMINNYMAYSNKMFKLQQQSLIKLYPDNAGNSRIRVLPSQAFTLFSDDQVNPEKPTTVVEHMIYDDTEENQRFAVWTDKEHYIINGKGNVVLADMRAMNNEEGKNPYGVLPFVHINQSIDMLYPIRPTDVISVQIAICLLLSDTALAQKYLSWATLLLKGVEGESKLRIGPGAQISLPTNSQGQIPDASYLQPQLNSDEVLRIVDYLIEKLLSTNNISAGTVIGQLQANQSSSGVSKMLDSIESTEDIGEQRSYFINAEKELWGKLAKNILPVWIKNKQVKPELAGAFSSDFELDIVFPEPKPVYSEADKIKTIAEKLKNGFITMKMALKEMNPMMTDDSIDELMLEIKNENMPDITEDQTKQPEDDNQEMM